LTLIFLELLIKRATTVAYGSLGCFLTGCLTKHSHLFYRSLIPSLINSTELSCDCQLSSKNTMANSTPPYSLPCNSDATASTRPYSSFLIAAGPLAAMMNGTTTSRIHHTTQKMQHQLRHSTQQERKQKREHLMHIIEAALAITEQADATSGSCRRDDKGNPHR
jgi:hypothetical protein